MIRMVRRAYLPAITDYMADLASNITTVKAAISGADMTEAESVLEVIIAGADKAAKATRDAYQGSRCSRGNRGAAGAG